MSTPVKCSVCGEQAYRNKRGELLAHTRRVQVRARPGVTISGAEVCPTYRKGVRP